tara:strand:+ start:5293 stop:6369 length:1077 start_codon:yes stop_codon:yes gene_type:complete
MDDPAAGKTSHSDLAITPLEDARALGPDVYLGEARHRFDQTHMLAPAWQVMAPASALASPGDHIVREIGGKPVILLRNEAGALKGFFNVCAHRAGPLATCDGKGAKRLRCAYHGWIYNLDGQLRVAPEMQDAKDFSRDGIKLVPVDVAEWQGLILARAGQGPDLKTALGEIAGRLADCGLSDMVHHHARIYDVDCNWKVYIDNYLEGYHVPSVHPGLNQLIDMSDYETTLYHNGSVQRSPVSDDSGPYAAGDALYVHIFPNTMLNILPGRMQTNRVTANGPDKCKVEFDFYYAPGFESRAAEDDAFSDTVQAEDRTICEHVQRGLASGAYSPGRLSPSQEAALWHWQNYVRAAHSRAV